MITNSFEGHLAIQRWFWVAVVGVGTLMVGYLLSTNFYSLAIGAIGLAWLLCLPYHHKLAIYLSVATFSSALIVPFFPGRPFMWEFAALLGWTGFIMTVTMRQYAPDTREVAFRHRWLLFGVIGYCSVLLITMFYRGFGLRILGSDVMGGRFYFQQLSCAIFPFLFVMLRLRERTLVRLFVLQCLLTVTYLVSDFVYSVAPKPFLFLLRFFELPGDAFNFEWQSRTGGIRRYQSLNIMGQGLFLLLLVRYGLKEFFRPKGVFIMLVAGLILGVGLLSGHRYLVLIIGITVIFCAYSQGFVTVRNLVISAAFGLVSLMFLYAFADRLPLAAQRAISFLPEIPIHPQAKADGSSTMITRRILRDIGWNLMPHYFWIGRGFAQSGTGDYSIQWDPTHITYHVNQGRFFNGFIGSMVNMGAPGTFFLLLFLMSGSMLSWRIMRRLRRQGCEDSFGRLCSIVSGLWMANVIAFIFLHGDSEYAMKTFSLQAGMLILCEWHLRKRDQPEPLEVEADESGDLPEPPRHRAIVPV